MTNKIFSSKECESYFLVGESVAKSKTSKEAPFGIVKSILLQTPEEQKIIVEMTEDITPTAIYGLSSTAVMYYPLLTKE